MVLGPALERVRERMEDDATKQNQKVAKFAALRESASDIYDEMASDQLEYDDLAAAALKTLVSYVFQARKATGASKHTGTKPACLLFLQTVPVDDLKELIDTPLNEPVAAVVATITAIPLATNTPALALTSSSELVLDVELPDGMVVKSQPPDWMGAALAPGSDTAARLVGHFITYKWPPLLGGWLVGKVAEVNTDKSIKIGTAVANFKVYYEADNEVAHHHLTLERYAKSNRSKVDAWAFVE